MMMGGMLAGHDQSGGEIIEKNGRKVSLTVADCYLDEGTIKTQNPKCRLYWFIDRRYSHSCWYFRPLL